MLEGMKSRGEVGFLLTDVIRKRYFSDKNFISISELWWFISFYRAPSIQVASPFAETKAADRETAFFRKGLIITLFIWNFEMHNYIFICNLNRVEKSFPQGEFTGNDTSAGHACLDHLSLLSCFLMPSHGCWQKRIRWPTKSHRGQIRDSPVLQLAHFKLLSTKE